MMKNLKSPIFIMIFSLQGLWLNACNSAESSSAKPGLSFYEVPLVCGADQSIGCGSRIKPLFIEAAKHDGISESWTNRQGTVIAFVWKEGKLDAKLADKLFASNEIEARLIKDKKKISELKAVMNRENLWYQGLEVDSLSIHEAGTIASVSTQVLTDGKMITAEEAIAIKPEIENYFKEELVKVRSFDALLEVQKTQWKNDVQQILAKHTGADRAARSIDFYYAYLQKKMAEDEACAKSCGVKKDCCMKK